MSYERLIEQALALGNHPDRTKLPEAPFPAYSHTITGYYRDRFEFMMELNNLMEAEGKTDEDLSGVYFSAPVDPPTLKDLKGKSAHYVAFFLVRWLAASRKANLNSGPIFGQWERFIFNISDNIPA